ncbi:HAD hydrolase-like protein [Sinisalibacter aestuarii]|uniref:Hydrolase n=1 Tax=Sinisalibacter aestuarii TaxID=2949426 RepID=A0ABQ5LQB7_9RHOB|nr:HAD hydrolase-like protein [Sinisalibacter aestuarii]GKY86257.1 hydrolase [Sinisalibacter aestuarii]
MKTVFLDLDGTLTESSPGIIASVIHALEALGIDAPPPEALRWVVGPALIDSFTRLGVPDPAEALRLYRERYTSVGLFENRVYDGIPEAMDAMAAAYRLCLATAKPHAYATRITAHFGLNRHLAHEFGPELDGTRNDKAELLAHALAELGLDPGACVMVGDRHHDIDAARAVGMASIGVGWGYGDAAELGHATAFCASPDALAARVADVLG